MAPRPEDLEVHETCDLPRKDGYVYVPSKEDIAQGVPTKLPTLVELKRVIPAKCFRPTLSESIPYVVKDYMCITFLYYSMVFMEEQPYQWLYYAYLPVYWLLQGTLLAALGVLGHDCGHGSFSKYETINNIFGNIIHSTILLPYYPWKMKHCHHHRNTGNIDTDNVWNPIREKDLLVAKPQMAKLFNPFNSFFAKHVINCCISLAVIASFVAFGLVPYAMNNGIMKLVVHYVIPHMVFIVWFSYLVFLQHHDNNMPWYGDKNWDYVRGLLSSIDRHYGFAHEMIHNIGTHQLHHMFAKVPHYHLEVATNAFITAYPELYRKSDESPPLAFLRIFPMWLQQHVLKDDVQVHTYKDVDEFNKMKEGKKAK